MCYQDQKNKLREILNGNISYPKLSVRKIFSFCKRTYKERSQIQIFSEVQVISSFCLKLNMLLQSYHFEKLLVEASTIKLKSF